MLVKKLSVLSGKILCKLQKFMGADFFGPPFGYAKMGALQWVYAYGYLMGV